MCASAQGQISGKCNNDNTDDDDDNDASSDRVGIFSPNLKNLNSDLAYYKTTPAQPSTVEQACLIQLALDDRSCPQKQH